MNSLLSKYSHSKLKGFFKDENIRRIFNYFWIFGKETTLAKMPEAKREVYEQTIDQFQLKFNSSPGSSSQ